MIPSARITVPPVAINFSSDVCLFQDILKCGDGRMDGNMCENNYHYLPGLSVGRVDQFQVRLVTSTGRWDH